MPVIGRALPRVGASLALAASLLGVGAGQIVVHAQDAGPAAITVDGAKLPYIVCGIDTRLESGGAQSILLTADGVPLIPAQIDPAAIGETFRIHGRTVADCGAGPGFKGLADRTANTGSATLPVGLSWLNGSQAQPTSAEMDALGCSGSTDGCTMLVPVATGVGGGQLQSVVWAAMQVTTTGVNSHSGVLLGDSAALETRQ